MKKQEYVSPEMEIVEIKTSCCFLAGSIDDNDFNKPDGRDDNTAPDLGGF